MGKKRDPNIMERCEDLLRDFERRYDLQDLECEYRGGDGKKEVLPLAVAVCLRENIKVPEWARDEFCWAVLAGMGPWEKDFGHRRKDDGFSRRFWKLRRQIDKIGKSLFNWIEEQRKENPVDPNLFDKAGKKFGVSAGTASALYYSKEVKAAVTSSRMALAVDQLSASARSLELGNHLLRPCRVRAA
jgi:hypothetical protein